MTDLAGTVTLMVVGAAYEAAGVVCVAMDIRRTRQAVERTGVRMQDAVARMKAGDEPDPETGLAPSVEAQVAPIQLLVDIATGNSGLRIVGVILLLWGILVTLASNLSAILLLR